MGESIRGSVDNVMHSTTTSAGGGAAASSNGGSGPRQVGAYLSPFPEESASFYEDLLADDGPLVGGRRFGGTLMQRLNGAGVPGHQQLAAIIREFESVAENPDMFLFDTSRGNRRGGGGGPSFAIGSPGMDIDSSWGPAAAFIGRPQGRRRPDLGDWASSSSVRTMIQSPGGGPPRRPSPLSAASLESLNLGLQAPLRIINTRGSPASGTGGGQAIDRSWLQSPLQTEEISHMYSSGTCPPLVLWQDITSAGDAPSSAPHRNTLAEGAKHLLRLLFMRYQPLRPLVDKTIFNICLDPRLEDAVLQVLVQALLSLACSNNRSRSHGGHSVHGWSFVGEASNGKVVATLVDDDENDPFPPWYLYESPMLPSGPGRSSAATEGGGAAENAAAAPVTASPTVRALARIHNALLQRSSSSTISRSVSNSSPSPKRTASGVKRRRSSMTTAEQPHETAATEVRRSKRLTRTHSAASAAADEEADGSSARKLQRTKSIGGKEGGKSTATSSEDKPEGVSAASGHHHHHQQQKASRSSQPILVAPVNVVMQLLGSPLLRSSPAHTLFLVTVLVSMLTLPPQQQQQHT
ncbi:E3 ubiquitin-protein ligase, partial [Perkinsus olseni]